MLQKMPNNPTSQNIKCLVTERIKTMSGNIHIHVGSNQTSLSKEELIKNISNNTEVGQKLIKQQMAYIQATASGEIYKLLQNE